MDQERLKELALKVRREVIAMAARSGSPHVGSALSCADILAALYGGTLRLAPWEARDIFIMSKAHAAMALYATLAETGVMARELLLNYYKDEGSLPAHLDRGSVPGVEVSAGSLGHGFSMGLGMAWGLKRQNSGRRVFVLVGDGETQEGSIWEGALFASKLGLDNFTAIIDYNNLQGYGRPREVCHFEPVAAKWEAFGWQVTKADGHDPEKLRELLSVPGEGRPRLIIASTVKGKDVSFMEDQLIWHYFRVTEEHRVKALAELS